MAPHEARSEPPRWERFLPKYAQRARQVGREERQQLEAERKRQDAQDAAADLAWRRARAAREIRQGATLGWLNEYQLEAARALQKAHPTAFADVHLVMNGPDKGDASVWLEYPDKYAPIRIAPDGTVRDWEWWPMPAA